MVEKSGGNNGYMVDGKWAPSLDNSYFASGNNRDDEKWYKNEEKRRKQEEKRMQAQEKLGDAENSKINRGSGNQEGVGALYGAEKEGDSLYTVRKKGGGAGGAVRKMTPMGRVMGALGKFGGKQEKGPILTLISILVVMGGIIFGAQSAMPFAITSRAMDEFNSMEVSNNRRTYPMTRFMLSQSAKKSNGMLKLIFSSEKFTLTDTMKNQLKKQGITVVDVGGGKYQFDIDMEDGTTKRMTFDEMISDKKTRNRYIAGAKKWRGGTSGWFGSVMDRVLMRIGMTRNRWKNFDASEEVETRKQKYQTTAREKATDVADEDMKKVTEEELEEDETCSGKTSGGKCKVSSSVDGDNDKVDNRKNAVEAKKKLAAKVNKVASAAGGISGAVNTACMIYSGFELIHTLAAAQNAIESLNLATGYMEAVQKVQAGEGAHSPMNDYNDQLTQPYTLEDKDLDTGEILSTTTTTAVSAVGMGLLMGDNGGSDLKNSSTVQSVNSEALLSKINFLGQSMTYTAEVLNDCAYMKIAGAIVNIAVTVVTSIFTGGIGAAVKSLVVDTAIGGGLGTVMTLAMGAFLPAAAKMIASSYIDDKLGAGMGEALISGLHKYQGDGFQGNGGSMANADYLSAFQGVAAEVGQEKAEYERETRSPLDITSEYTFLGSIMYSFLALGMGKNSSNLTTLAASMTRLVSRSVAKVTPAASAINRTSLFNAEEGDCEVSATIEAQTDIYCNPYYITDITTLGDGDESYDEYTPMNVYEKVLSLWKKSAMTWDREGHYLICEAKDKTANENRSLYQQKECSGLHSEMVTKYTEDIAEDAEYSNWGLEWCGGNNVVYTGYESSLTCIKNVVGLDDASNGDEYIINEDGEYVAVDKGEGDYVVRITYSYDRVCTTTSSGKTNCYAKKRTFSDGSELAHVNLIPKYYASSYGAQCRYHQRWSVKLSDTSDERGYFHVWYWSYGEPVNFKVSSTDPSYSGEVGKCVADPELDSYGNPVINPYGELGVYITACTARTAPAGLASSEISSYLVGVNVEAGTKTGGSDVSTVLGYIPVIGDAVDIMDAAGDKDKAGWISASNCVANGSSDWNERFKWYQRYIEDQGMMENMGLIAESSVIGVLDTYYEENPLDNSYEGILARYSGMSKEEVTDTLALIDYINWVDKYDPAELGPRTVEVREISVVEQVIGSVQHVIMDVGQMVGVAREEVVYGGRRMEYWVG